MVLRKRSIQYVCEGNTNGFNKLANAQWITVEIEKLVRDVTTLTLKSVAVRIKKKFGVVISYYTAWNAKTICMEKIVGSYDEGYKQLLALCHEIPHTNPGSIASTWREDTSLQWTETCVAFKASLDGLVNRCRPILGLDGFFLKGKYVGVCLSILGLDANNGLFAIAVFLCKSKCKESWTSFLLKVQYHLMLFCFRHMYKNMKKYHKGSYLERLTWGATKALRKVGKQIFMYKLADVDPSAKAWLDQEPYDHWCRSHFDFTSKCEHITNNFSESFNWWIMKIRDKPLQKSIKRLNLMIMKLMFERRTKAATWDQDGLVPRAAAHLEKVIYCSHYHFVSAYNAMYSGVVHPVSDSSHWEKPPTHVKPPPLVRGPGRPRKVRIKGVDEGGGSQKRCSKCGGFGHNKKTCKGVPAADIQPNPSIKPCTRTDIPSHQAAYRRAMGIETPTNTTRRTYVNNKGGRPLGSRPKPVFASNT
ncbi:hypothetical protein GIB67_002103 [Kingdonia uniflora]|uniref:CCHC-type domain-containing protein n=1 Tax=Kingdonia uniflora TaxID=39325 RepID=A0A7J7KWL4_9MAGN|nr:hypothetical protein GIB67_002103 [Kingdonia uniflora]